MNLETDTRVTDIENEATITAAVTSRILTIQLTVCQVQESQDELSVVAQVRLQNSGNNNTEQITVDSFMKLHEAINSNKNVQIVRIEGSISGQCQRIINCLLDHVVKTMGNLIFLDIMDFDISTDVIHRLMYNYNRSLTVQYSQLNSNTFVYYKNADNRISKVNLDSCIDIDSKDLFKNLTERNIGLDLIIDGLKIEFFGQFIQTQRSLLDICLSPLKHLALMYLSLQHDILCFKYLLSMAKINSNCKLDSQFLNDLSIVDHSLSTEDEIVFKLKNILNEHFDVEIEMEDVGIVKFLIEINCPDHKKTLKSPTTFALENQYVDILLLLLKADAQFPPRFSIDNVDESVKRFADSRNELHRMIANGNDECLRYIETMDKSKYYLSSENKSAVLTAIENKQFEIYVHLKERGLQFKDGDEASIINEINDDERAKFKEAQKCFPQLKHSSIFHLLSKSRTDKSEMDNKSKDTIESYYRQLIEHGTIDILFSVLDHCNNLSIHFDYDSDNVCTTKAIDNDNAACQLEREIYIGAKAEDEKQLLGAIAHQLTHLAMEIVFQNDGKPYRKNDNEHKIEFSEIVEALNRRKQELDEILSGTFDSYEDHYWSSELIAQVPKMLVKNNGDHSYLISNALALHNYYGNFVMQECRNFIQQMSFVNIKSTIEILNNYSNVLNEIKQVDLEFTYPIDVQAIANGKQLLILSTPSTLLTAVHVIRHGKSSLPNNFLMFDYEQFQNNAEDIKEALKSSVCNGLIIEIPKELQVNKLVLEQICEFIYKNASKQLIVIEDKERNQFENFLKKSKKLFIKQLCINHLCKHHIESYSLNNFNNKSKELFLNKYILLQSNKVKLTEVIDKNCDECLDLIDAEILTNLIKSKMLAIGQKQTVAYDKVYHMERRFKWGEESLSEADLVDRMDQLPIVLISGTAGMGKSTILSRMTQLIKGYCVIMVDLNSFSDVLHRELCDRSFSISNVDAALTFFIDNFSGVKNELTSISEVNLLLHLIKMKRKVIVMLDGFDEISSIYAVIVMDLIRVLQGTKLKQLWVTTRPHFKTKLENQLQTKSLQILPFSRTNQMNFLCCCWSQMLKSKVTSANAKDRLMSYAKMLIDSLTKSIRDDENSFSGIPLQSRMLAVAYRNEALDFTNSEAITPVAIAIHSFADCFQKFIDEKQKIKFEKMKIQITNNLVLEAMNRFEMEFIENHEIAAIFVLFDDKTCELLLTNEQNRKGIEFLENLAKGSEDTGLITGVDEVNHKYKPLFIHRTFAEYFASKFICRKISEESGYSVGLFLSITDETSELLNSFMENVIGNLKVDDASVLMNEIGSSINSPITFKSKNIGSALSIAVKHELKHTVWLLLNSFHFLKNRFNPSCLCNKTIAELCRSDYDDIVQLHCNRLTADESEKQMIIEYLIAENATLLVAIRKGLLSIFKIVINHCILLGIDIDHLTNDSSHSKSLLMEAARYDSRLEFVKYLVEKCHCDASEEYHLSYGNETHLTVEIGDHKGYTALHFAVTNNAKLVVNYLINDCKCNVDGANNSLITPLQAAAKDGQLQMVKHLIDNHHANPHRMNSQGLNVLHFAALNYTNEMLNHLIFQCNLDPDGGKKCFCSPLHIMAEIHKPDKIEHYIKNYKANVHAIALDGKTALHLAAFHHKLDTIRYLIENYKLDVNKVCKRGKTALHYAVGSFNMTCSNVSQCIGTIDYLIDKCKADVNAVDANNCTPLQDAINIKDEHPYRGYDAIIKHLIGKGSKTLYKLLSSVFEKSEFF